MSRMSDVLKSILDQREDNLARNLLADEFDNAGRPESAAMVRGRTDNSIGAAAALRAIKRVASYVAAHLGRPVTREAVYVAIDSERDYQDRKWGGEKANQVAAFITYMQHHMTRAIAEVSTKHGDADALEQVRKITALGVACMEAHGAPLRK